MKVAKRSDAATRISKLRSILTKYPLRVRLQQKTFPQRSDSMILKITAILGGLLILAVGIGGIIKTSQDEPRDRSIASVAKRAKSQGKSRISLSAPIVEYPGSNMGLEEALQNYSVVIAEPEERKSYIGDGSDDIRTAFKFRILEALSRRNAVVCATCPPLTDLSNKFQPALSNEFILELSGGTVMVNGVEVTMIDGEIQKFEDGQRYLLFVSFTPGGMARLAAGASGIFRITPEESLEGMGRRNYRLTGEITSRYSKKLSAFKQGIP
jgi:hypothetical protein